MGQEECQYQFRNNRWNCTTSSPSVDLEDIYGEVVEISKLQHQHRSSSITNNFYVFVWRSIGQKVGRPHTFMQLMRPRWLGQ